MSTSLRDQLLKAGLINKKQANDVERQQERRERQPQKRHGTAPVAPAAIARSGPPPAKVARDQALNRQRNDKAEKKARLAQIKQLVAQCRLPTVEDGESFSFIDGTKIRRLRVNASIREKLGRGEIVIVRNDGGYDLIPVAAAARILERDEHAVVRPGVAPEDKTTDQAYDEHPIPDDLIW